MPSEKTTSAPLELVFWKWRKTYQKKWGLKPPAKHVSSMKIERRWMDGNTEKVRVCIQTGKRSFEDSTVVVEPSDWERYAKVRAKLDNPKTNWESLDAETQDRIMDAWSHFESWVGSQDELNRMELSNRLLRFFDMIKDRHRVPRPVGLTLHIALGIRQLDQLGIEAFEGVAMMLVDMNAALGLYRECRFFQRRTREGNLGYDGGARNLWERKHELSSAEARWAFAKKRMKFYGFR